MKLYKMFRTMEIIDKRYKFKMIQVMDDGFQPEDDPKV
jgi:hypothetical protein